MKKVAIVMGSRSDWEVMRDAFTTLREFEVPVVVRVLSAHRTPAELDDFLLWAVKNDVGVIIPGAGGAAHLPGVIASKTVLPVIGVPCKSSISLEGLDSLLSIVQMPPGIPVATVGINNSRNAALLAISILALSDTSLKNRLEEYRAGLRKRVLEDDKKLRAELQSQP